MAGLALAIAALRDCDRELRSAISKIAAEADAEQLSAAVSWLKELQRILDNAESSCDAGSGAAGNGATGTPRPSGNHGGARVNKPVTRTHRQAGAEYPLFFREGENLVKIGWSKKSREEYEHKAPKPAVIALANALAVAGHGGRRITMDRLIPIRSAGGPDVPDYQAYVALAWLRQLGLVTQHGRQGYTVPGKVADLSAEAARRWEALPSR